MAEYTYNQPYNLGSTHAGEAFHVLDDAETSYGFGTSGDQGMGSVTVTLPNLSPRTLYLVRDSDGIRLSVVGFDSRDIPSLNGATSSDLLAAIRGAGSFVLDPTIVDGSGNPIAGAAVELQQDGARLYGGLTDATGKVLSGVAHGFALNSSTEDHPYSILAVAPGYEPTSPLVVVLSGNLSPQITLAPISVEPPSTVGVCVVYGDPSDFELQTLAGMALQFKPKVSQGAILVSGDRIISPISRTIVVNSSGHFEIEMIPSTSISVIGGAHSVLYLVTCEGLGLSQREILVPTTGRAKLKDLLS